jgi:LPS O-antigen subunit length determinant protein (WzzB/FepE family)
VKTPVTEQTVYSNRAQEPRKDVPASWKAADDREEAGLIDVLTQLARRKWLIGKITALATLTGVILGLLLPAKYTATTKLMPPQQTQSTASMMMNQLANIGAGSVATVASGGFGLKNPNDIYIGLLTSRPVADAIIQQFNLLRAYRAKDMTAARKKLADATAVASEKNGFIAVSVTDKDRQRAAEMANAYTKQLRSITKTLAVTEAAQRRRFYEDQLKQAKEDLLAAEESFQQVQQAKGLVQLDAQAKTMIESLALLRAQAAAKEVEVEALRSYSTEHNSELELARGELASLRGAAARLEQRNHSSGFADLGLGDVPGAGMEYLRGEHELKYRQAMFDLLIKQYDAARLDEAKDAAVIQVVEPAIPPEHKTSPDRMSIVSTFMVCGFLSACLYLYVCHALERNSGLSESFTHLAMALTAK